MDKKELMRKIKRAIGKGNIVCVELKDENGIYSGIYITDADFKSFFRGHIRLFFNGEIIAHISPNLIEKVYRI